MPEDCWVIQQLNPKRTFGNEYQKTRISQSFVILWQLAMCMHSAFCKRFPLWNHAFWRGQMTILKYWGSCASPADLPTKKQQLQALNLLVLLLPEANRDTLKVRIANTFFLAQIFSLFLWIHCNECCCLLTFFFFSLKLVILFSQFTEFQKKHPSAP